MSFDLDIIVLEGSHVRWSDVPVDVVPRLRGVMLDRSGLISLADFEGHAVDITYDDDGEKWGIEDYDVPNALPETFRRRWQGAMYTLSGRTEPGRRFAAMYALALADVVDGLIGVPDTDFGLVPMGVYTPGEFRAALEAHTLTAA